MGTIDALRAERRGLLKCARDICDVAAKAGRDFTRAERTEVEKHLAKAGLLNDQIAQLDGGAQAQREKDGDDALKAAIMEFENMFSGGPIASGDGSAFGGRATKGESWGNSFQKQLSRGRPAGQKDLLTPSGAVSVAGIIDGLVPISDKVETVLQLVSWKPIGDTDAYSFLEETERSHRAASVEAGALKPTSTYELSRVDDYVRTIAHLSEPITKSWLSDIGLLSQYLDMVLREGLTLETEWQILSAGGVGDDLVGLLSTPGIQAVPFNLDILTTCRNAITALDLSSIPPGAFAMNPADWETCELAATTTGEFLLKDGTRVAPIDKARRQLWGYPVALSVALAEGTGLLVDWRGSTKGWVRQGATVDWSESFHVTSQYDEKDSTGFERNQVMFRAETRLGFGVLRPRGVVEIDLDAGS